MGRDSSEWNAYRRIADDIGITEFDVSKVVRSFFDIIRLSASKLPFDNRRKIFSKDKFDEYGKVHHIPFIGRLGPVYSRYLAWRSNEAGNYDMEPRSSYRSRITDDDLESLYDAVMSGAEVHMPERKSKKDLYHSVWLVGKNGKRLARQVIPKNKE